MCQFKIYITLTVGLVACQLGSKVLIEPTGEMQGLDGGEPGALAGCITCKFSLWEMMCGGDKLSEPLLRVSATKKNRHYITVINLM